LTRRLGSSKVSKHLILIPWTFHIFICTYSTIHILNRLSARAKRYICSQWFVIHIYQSTNLQYGTIVKSVRICRAIVLNRQCSNIEQYHLKYFAMFLLLYKRLQMLL
jgi:hypothetical protein